MEIQVEDIPNQGPRFVVVMLSRKYVFETRGEAEEWISIHTKRK